MPTNRSTPRLADGTCVPPVSDVSLHHLQPLPQSTHTATTWTMAAQLASPTDDQLLSDDQSILSPNELESDPLLSPNLLVPGITAPVRCELPSPLTAAAAARPFTFISSCTDLSFVRVVGYDVSSHLSYPHIAARPYSLIPNHRPTAQNLTPKSSRSQRNTTQAWNSFSGPPL